MSHNRPLYRPDAAAIAALCARLCADGLIDAGPDVELRLRAAYARLDPMEPPAVARVARAVCLKSPDPEARAALDTAVAAWVGGLRPVITPTVQPTQPDAATRRPDATPSPARPPADDEPFVTTDPRRRATLVVLLALGAALAVGLVIGPGSDGEPDVAGGDGSEFPSDATSDGTDGIPRPTDAMASDASAHDGLLDASAPSPADAGVADAAPDVAPLARRPALLTAPEEIPGRWPTPPALAALAALALMALTLAAYALGLRRLRPDDPIDLTPPDHPPAPLPPPPDPPPRILPRDADARLAAGSGRTTADPTSRVLDIAETVRATAARAGVIPALRWRPLRRPEPMHIWVDWPARARTPTLARAVDELDAALTRGGVRHTTLHFTRRPDQLIRAGRALTIDGLALDRAETRVAVITDGRGIERLGRRARRQLVDRLARWPRLALFVFGALDPDALAEQLDGVVPVYAGETLLPWLVQIEPAPPAPLDPRLLQTWAATCALAPRGATDDDAFELRRALGLHDIPASAIELLRADAGDGGLGWPPARRAELLDWLSAHAPEAFADALAWWRDRYARLITAALVPDRDDTDHADAAAQWQLEAATLDLWTDDLTVVAVTVTAIDALARPAEARALLAPLAPADIPGAAAHLPWAWSALTDATTRRRLRALGLAAAIGELPDDTLERPPRVRPLLALAAGLLCAAAIGVTIAPRAPTTAQTACAQRRVAADGRLADVWRCGDVVAVRPDEPHWPAHSAIGLWASPDDPAAAELALALLDRGATDTVWWGALPPASEADQRIAVSLANRPCPPAATACVRAESLGALIDRLGDTPSPLAEVWPGVTDGHGWLLGVTPSDAGADASLDATVDATVDAERDSATDGMLDDALDGIPNGATDGMLDATGDAADPRTPLTGLSLVDGPAERFTLRVDHPEGTPLRPVHQVANGTLIVRFPAARWRLDRRLLSVDDPHVAAVQAVGDDQLYIRPHSPAASELTPRLTADAAGVVLAIDRVGLTPPSIAAAPLDAAVDAAPLDAAPPDAGPPPPPFAPLPATRHRPRMVTVRSGTYPIGCPEGEPGCTGDERRRRVTLTRGYWIAESEVTQAQYTAVMGRNPSHFRGTADDARRPVEQVNWRDAVEYCNRLSALEGLDPAYEVAGEAVEWDREAPGYRLPTEAEWEVAARAGTTTATYAGELEVLGERNAPVLDAIAWYGGNSGSLHPWAFDSSGWAEKQHPHAWASTHPVKGKQPNAWGLYDMLGNVEEWVWDWYASGAPAEAVDPAGPPYGYRRVFRGGSFNDFARGVRAADRVRWLPAIRSGDHGFRPVRSAPRAR